MRLRLPPTIVRYERHSFAVNFIPFGAGQFQNGQRRKGWLFLGAEAVLARRLGRRVRHQLRASTALTPHRRLQRSRSRWASSARPRPSITRRKTRRARCSRSSWSSGGLFFAVAIWGVIDAIHHYQPEVPLPDGAKVVARRPSGCAAHAFARRPRRRLGILKGTVTMATLKIAVPGKGTKVYRIHKKITSLGRGEEADVDAARSARWPTATCTSTSTAASSTSRRTEKDAEVVRQRQASEEPHKLQHEDRIRIGSAEIEFSLYDQPVAEDVSDSKMRRSSTPTSKLYEFCAQADGQLRAARRCSISCWT